MPDSDKWRRFAEGVRGFVKILDRIIVVCAIVFVVLLVLGIGFCLVEYARM